MKLLKENIRKMLQHIGTGKEGFGQDPQNEKQQSIIHKWDYIKLKSFCTVKRTIIRVKRQPT
jgi:hypothetical protein